MDQPQRSNAAPVWTPRLVREIATARDLPTAAVLMATHRVPIFPCWPHGKQPLVEHGLHDATSDVRVVDDWWRRWPAANIAIPTGFASGLDVVDVDVHAQGSGYRAFAEARAHGHGDRWAWLVRTPSDGLHAYYLRTAPDEQRSWQVPSKHVDFRGDGGYIIAPPSVTEAGSYRLISIANRTPEPVDARSLRNFLDPPRPIPAGRRTGLVADAAGLAAWVAQQPEGGRNRSLFWAACRMVEAGHQYDDTAAALGEAAQRAGLSEREALTTIRSAYRSASANRSRGAQRPPPQDVDRRPMQTTTREGIEL